MFYADTIPSPSALRTDPDPLRPWPLQSTVQRSRGCPPPAPRWPRLSRLRRKHDVRCQLRGGAQTPADQEPPAPVRLPWCGQGEPPPVIPARAFGTVVGTPPAPPLRPQRRQEGFDRRLPASTPDICLPRDGPDMGVLMCLPPQPQVPMLPIDALPRHPGGRDARVAGALQPLLRQRWCGRTGTRRGHPGALAAALVLAPCFGHLEGTIKQDGPLGTRRGQEHPNLTMRNAPRCAALLARSPRPTAGLF